MRTCLQCPTTVVLDTLRRPMTRALRRLAPVATATALVLTLAACGDDQPPAEATTVTVTNEATPESLDKPEQQQIDAATAKKALPVLEDMPDKWVVNVTPPDTHTSTYDPSVCADVEMDSAEARAFNDEHRKVRETVHFSENKLGVDDHVFATVSSYDQPYPLSFFDKAGEHVTDCSTYTDTRNDRASTWKTRAINAPMLGDRSFGVRYQPTSVEGRNIDVLSVRSGKNLIEVTLTTHNGTYDDKRLSTYAQDILDTLKKSS